ncbi:MAG: Fe-S cluster assembly ATPase SufC [Bacilli bacterium]|nr:Fe-S cluster assembly ATPase SufC [Bacilli bacterium]
MLEINNLTVSVSDKIILKDFSLTIKEHEIHTLMGLNGSGKSTICKVLMGDPTYKIVEGSIFYKGIDLLKQDTVSRARMGLYLVNQNPIEIPGVKNSEMLRVALEQKNNKHYSVLEFYKIVNNILEKIKLDKDFIHRGINENMSGGERKKNELLHLWVLEPDLIILDEIDSGVDIDNLNIISESLKEYYETHNASFLIITHHTNILKKLVPNYVHILNDGKIIESKDHTLAFDIENNGFNRTNKVSESIDYE